MTEMRNLRGTSQELSSFETIHTIVEGLLQKIPATFVAATCNRDWALSTTGIRRCERTQSCG